MPPAVRAGLLPTGALVILALRALAVAEVRPAVPAPDTPAGRALSNWLELFNSGQPEHLQGTLKLFRQTSSGEPAVFPLDRATRLRRHTGGFDLKRVVESSRTRVKVLLQERDGDQMAEGNLEVEPNQPHGIVRWDLMEVARPAEFALSRKTEAAALKDLQAYVDAMAAQDRFSGCVLVARNGKVLFAEVRGQQNREAGVANRPDTKYNLGSMNKMFTAVAIAQLAQEGKLRFSDTVGKHLPDYPQLDVAGKVTIHQLLTHTGGTGDIFGPDFTLNRAKLKEPADYIALYGKRAPEFEPGSRYRYSNYGFVLAGAIIERVSGLSYYEYVRKRIYAPAGMKDSDSYWKTEDTPNLAMSYMESPSAREPTAWTPQLQSTSPQRAFIRPGGMPMRGSPAGGGYSTCTDLLRFATALTRRKLLDASHTRLITTGKSGTPDETYGYGFAVSRINDTRTFGHGGGAPGISADLKIFPDSGYVVVVLSNLGPPTATRVSDYVAARLPAR